MGMDWKQWELEGLHKKEGISVGPLLMGLESEKRPQQVCCRSGMRLGDWAWRDGGRGEVLLLASLFPGSE